MRQSEIAVWNTLHDGSIEAITGFVPGELHIRIGIPYLCAHLPTANDFLHLRVIGCSLVEYVPNEGATLTDLASIGASDIEVLSASLEKGVASIVCAAGILRMIYEAVHVSTAEGELISQPELEASARRYWMDWEENAKRSNMH